MKAFIDEVSRVLKIKRNDLIEKDIILHKLLLALSNDDFFRRHFLFKGGTCLIKSYLGYYRFSEDIDFTWRNQEVFDNLSQKRIRSYLSKLIDDVGKTFEKFCKKYNLDFIADKSNRRYVELGGGNKTVTFKVWYLSEILKHEAFVKIQINFVECLKYKPITGELRSLLSDNKELEILFPQEYMDYSKRIVFPTYDIKEILCEKVRSILTRRGVKARDFVDVYLISKGYNINIEELREQIMEKTLFILNLYQKYRKNIEEKRKLINSKELFVWGAEKNLLLIKINERDFYEFLKIFTEFLKNISDELHAIKNKDTKK